jgi:peptide-methionine (S)-S-oxide reductase
MRKIIAIFLIFTSIYSLTGNAARSAPKTQTAYLAGGCFWGMEELLRSLKGVTDVEAGYTGGRTDQAFYKLVSKGASGHAESVKLTFDPQQASFEDILLFFFKIHDPTTMNQQGNDKGTQYRSAIFYTDNEQRAVAEKVKTRVEKSGAWKKPIVTEIVAFNQWFKAEDEHQDYLQKNPGGYTCHSIRNLTF